jgi:hypothetical protein
MAVKLKDLIIPSRDLRDGPCIFRNEGRIIWTNGHILVIDDPRAIKYFGSELERVQENNAYGLIMVGRKICIGGIENAFPLNEAIAMSHVREEHIMPAFYKQHMTVNGNRPAVAVMFYEPQGFFPLLPGGFYDSKQFDYLAEASTETYTSNEGRHLHFMDGDRHRGMVTALYAAKSDFEKLK